MNKVYGLAKIADKARDSRKKPRIPTSSVFFSALVMLLVRMGSLNAMEQSKRSAFWKRWIGRPLPSADTIGRVAEKMDCEIIRSGLHKIYTRQKRNKALKGFSQGLFALVIDGHESSSSYLRCCSECLEREIETRNGKRTQYYHRLVAALLVCKDRCILLDCELQRPGEDEVAACIRLIRRLLANYPRAFDIIIGDGLYLRANFFKIALAHGKDVIAILKDERRDLLKDAHALFDNEEPRVFLEGKTEYRWWDIEHFNSWPQLGRSVRVVRSLESTKIRRQITGEEEQLTSEWIWATTLSLQRASTKTVVKFGHARWWIENQGGFNDLVNLWHANHVYKHHPNAILTFWLLTMFAYNLFHAFIRLNLKPVLRRRYTDLHLASLIVGDFYQEIQHPLARAPT